MYPVEEMKLDTDTMNKRTLQELGYLEDTAFSVLLAKSATVVLFNT